MTFVQLKYFVQIVEHQSIAKAAEACFVSYNAMYKALKSLEKELQVSLVFRDAAGITLTSAGELFYNDVLKILTMEQNWKTHFHTPAENAIVKIFSVPLFINNHSLKIIADNLQKEHILLDYYVAFPEYIEPMLKQKKDYLFIYPHAPKYIIANLAKEHRYQCEYLCSDECSVFIDAKYLSDKQTTITLNDLAPFTPIKITNDYQHLTSFDAMALLENRQKCYTFQTYEEALPKLLMEKTFLLLRSSLANHVQTHYSAQIKALPLEDFPTGIDYYIAYLPQSNSTVKKVAKAIKTFCQEHYSQEKFF